MAVLPIKFSNLFSVEPRERLGGVYRHAQRAKQATANPLGVGQVTCPYVGFTEGIVFAPQGDLYFEELLFHFHHETMIAQGVGQRLSHRFELHKKLFSLFLRFRLDFLPGCPADCQEKTFNNRRFFVTC